MFILHKLVVVLILLCFYFFDPTNPQLHIVQEGHLLKVDFLAE